MSLAEGAPPDGPLAEVPESDPGPLPDDAAIAAEFAVPYPLTPAQLRHFAEQSYVKLPAVLTPG
ncbi:MAG: phytanoyl-CoA dioxygenase family protein, partial [Pseudonocardiaceae bacterium]